MLRMPSFGNRLIDGHVTHRIWGEPKTLCLELQRIFVSQMFQKIKMQDDGRFPM